MATKPNFQQIAHSINIMVQSDWAAEVDEIELAKALEEDGATARDYPIPTEDGLSEEDMKRFPRSCAVIAEAQ